ncbi:MAG TPA: sulfotransferase [Gaiellaceae bacterium]|nr:sulfotransferase [Gaiellaceae bacterium]
MHELASVHVVRQAAWTAQAYGATAVRVAVRGTRARLRRTLEERLVFVVGSPRSGTSFTAGAIGDLPAFVDLGEVPLLKAAIPELVELPEDEQATEIRHVLQRVRSLAFVRRLRGVEQTPETGFVLPAALSAFPGATAVHVVRDGRDVVCSLLERGWLSARRGDESDDANLSYGVHPRFWVEPGRREEFTRVSDARRAAWAWRRYVSAARSASERTVELRYEQLVSDPGDAAEPLAHMLGVHGDDLRDAFSSAHANSVGRWQRDLTAEQLADVEAEAGDLLAELGYA